MSKIRLSMGKYYTKEEWEEKRKRVLNTPMKDSISDMSEEAVQEVLSELFDEDETPEDRWREFLK